MSRRESVLTDNPDTDTLILLELDYLSLIAACQANPYLYSLCQHPNFWTNKLVKDFGQRFATFITPTRSAQEVYYDLYLISREFGPEVIKYISSVDSFDDLFLTLDQIFSKFDQKILEIKPSDMTLREYLRFLMNPINTRPESKRIAYILSFDDLMSQIILDETEADVVLDVTRFDPQNMSSAVFVPPFRSPRSTEIRPEITVDGRKILVPIWARPEGLKGFVGFLDEIVSYSAYSDLVPDILRAFVLG